MAEVLLGYNFFETIDPEETIQNILEMEIPNFSEFRPDVEPKLNQILHLALKRPREERYQSAEEMLTELESFIYGKGYGPTNEKLAAYAADLFGQDGQNAAVRWHRGETPFPEI
jgi:serine/threonine-protein kinase